MAKIIRILEDSASFLNLSSINFLLNNKVV